MKKGVHPTLFLATIRCQCGITYNVRSTKKDQRIELCPACHPFFTGKQKLIDTAGRIDKFRQRFAKMTPAAGAAAAAPAAEAAVEIPAAG